MSGLLNAINKYVEEKDASGTDSGLMPHGDEKNALHAVSEMVELAYHMYKEEHYSRFEVGDTVRVADFIARPKYLWNGLTHDCAGIIHWIGGNEAYIDFPLHAKWRAYLPEMQIVRKSIDPLRDFSTPNLRSFADYESFKHGVLNDIEESTRVKKSYGFVDRFMNIFREKPLDYVTEEQRATRNAYELFYDKVIEMEKNLKYDMLAKEFMGKRNKTKYSQK